MEVILWVLYMFTMFLYVVKSRCLTVGVSHSDMFGETYMGKLANRIVSSMDFDINQIKRSKHRTKRHFTTKYRNLECFGKDLKIKLSEDDFESIAKKKL